MMVDILDELKNAVKNDKILLGKDTVLKAIRDKSIKKVVLSSNTPNDLREDIEKYASLSEIPVENVDMNNEEMGTFCKRKYHVSVLALK